MAVNRRRGEVSAIIDGEERRLCLTLGALAELEDAFAADNLGALAERFQSGRLSARDLIRIIGAGLRGGGAEVNDAEVETMRIDGRLPARPRLRRSFSRRPSVTARRRPAQAPQTLERAAASGGRRGKCSVSLGRGDGGRFRHPQAFVRGLLADDAARTGKRSWSTDRRGRAPAFALGVRAVDRALS